MTARRVPIVMTGAAGSFGAALIRQLVRRTDRRVIATARDPARVSPDVAALASEVRKADFSQPDFFECLTGRAPITIRDVIAGVLS